MTRSEAECERDRIRRKDLSRLELVEAYAVAYERRDEIMTVVGSSPDDATAHARLRSLLGLSDIQTEAVMIRQMRSFTEAERDKVFAERDDLRRRTVEAL